MQITRLTAALALAAVATGQQLQPAGSLLRTTTGTYTRGGVGMNGGELLQRFDHEDLRGFGVEAAHPGFHVVRGVTVGIIDYAASTPNPRFDVTLYAEDPAHPGYPDMSAPLGGRAGVVPQLGLFLMQTVTFAMPVLAPDDRDLFVGVTIPPTNTQYWGVRLMVLPGVPGTAIFDDAGPALPTSPPEANSYRLFRGLGAGTFTYEARGQYLIDLLTRQPSGMAGAITNQAAWVGSNIAPGGTSMLSGLHPDASSPPLHPGRIDEVSFLYRDADGAIGAPVVFVAAFADFGANVPLAQFAPGSVGGSCLDRSASFGLGIRSLDAAREAWLVTTIPAAARNVIRGVTWTQQAIGLDLVNGALRGSQCSRQAF